MFAVMQLAETRPTDRRLAAVTFQHGYSRVQWDEMLTFRYVMWELRISREMIQSCLNTWLMAGCVRATKHYQQPEGWVTLSGVQEEDGRQECCFGV